MKAPLRRTTLFLCALVPACSEKPGAISETAAKGIAALARLQDTDGAWRSPIYEDLQGGPPLTALALLALAHHPGHAEIEAQRRALTYLRRQLRPDGQVGTEYPNFTTALTLLAFRILDPVPEELGRMAGFLVSQQLDERFGYHSNEPAFGGWGLGGPSVRPHERLRQDVSTLRHVLQALEAANRISEVRDRALRFLLPCQNFPGDGGFCYSRVTLAQNKAGEDPSTPSGFRSYGTATADGMECLFILGAERERRQSAMRWLLDSFSVEQAPGFENTERPIWGQGLFYYYLYSLTSALKRAGKAGDGFREAVANRLAQLQAPDGTWFNPNGMMKEDDPILCTCLALLALQ